MANGRDCTMYYPIVKARRIVDLEIYSRCGISLSSTINEAVHVADAKAKTYAADALSHNKLLRTPIPETQTIYIHNMNRKTILPPNLHLSRDDDWTPESDEPEGHCTINSLYGDESGTRVIERLRQLDFGDVYVMKIAYELTHVKRDLWVLERKIMEGGGSMNGDTIRWAEILFA